MVTQEQVRGGLTAVWGNMDEFLDWVWNQAAEDGTSLETIWEAAIVRVADKLGVTPEETEEVNDLLDGLVDWDELREAHADGFAEYRGQSMPSSMAAEYAEAAKVERFIDAIREVIPGGDW